MSATIAAPRYDTEAYRQAYGRIHGLVIQCLIIECFAVAAYRCYLPLARLLAQIP